MVDSVKMFPETRLWASEAPVELSQHITYPNTQDQTDREPRATAVGGMRVGTESPFIQSNKKGGF